MDVQKLSYHVKIYQNIGRCCEHENVKCHNECGIEMQRQYLLNHVETKCRLRRIPCQYCHCSFEHCYLKNHIKVCDNFLPPCPNYCGITDILRIDMGKHRKTCLLEIIQCTNGHKKCSNKLR